MNDQAIVRSDVLDAVYRAAAALAARAIDYFDRHARIGPRLHGRAERAAAAREWMKLSERLLRIMAWTLARRPARISDVARPGPEAAIPPAPASDYADVDLLPAAARALIEESADLYGRAERLDARDEMASPARVLQDRLSSTFQGRSNREHRSFG